MDPRQHRAHAHPTQTPWFRLRLAPGTCNLRAGVLPLGTMAVRAAVQTRSGVPQVLHSELGSSGPNRVGERAGDRRERLAVRCNGRATRDSPVVPAHHGLRGGVVARTGRPGRLARAGQSYAAQLDWPIRGGRVVFSGGRRKRAAARLHHQARHPVRCHLPGSGTTASTGPACGANQPATARLHRTVSIHAGCRGGVGHCRKGRGCNWHLCTPPPDWRSNSSVGRELCSDGVWRRRGHGCPGPRPARLGVCDRL